MVNFFVYTDGEDYICIDTGMASLLARVNLKRLGINPERVSHVFLTHTDYDHTGGLKLFKNAQVYISKQEEQMINGQKSRFLGIKYNSLKRDYQLLEDNEELKIGNIVIKAICAPGHTPGSMAYIINDSYLFTGDTFTLRRNKLYPFYRLPNMDTSQQKETIKELARKADNVSWVFTAHTGYSDNFQELINSMDNK